MLKQITLLAILLGTASIHAQSFGDAVRYSQTNAGGTARTLGVGGAFGAMGGDFSAVNINPAGIGQYYRGEFTFSPSLNFYNTDAYINSLGKNTSTKNNGSSFSIDNIGLVFNSTPTASNWTSSNFIIGFSKLADFGKTFEFNGSTIGSITERFVEKANGKGIDDLDDFESWPAYKTGSIFDVNEDKNYETDIEANTLVQKNQIINQKGYINELSLGWGGNLDNKLNIGATIGIPFVSFEESKTYVEVADDDFLPTFNRLEYQEYLNTSGAGINIKAGFTYKAADAFRIGLAFHSPTWYVLTDDYNTYASYNYTDTTTHFFEHFSPDGSFKYQLKTPMKIIGSLGTIYRISDKVQGFINGDVEWVDYANNEFDFTEYSDEPSEQQYTQEVNNDIHSYLGQTVSVRIGTELAIGKLRLRVGVENGQSPYNADVLNIKKVSAGFGFREENFFLDFGIRASESEQGYLAYSVLDKTRDLTVTNSDIHTNVVMTAGFKF